MLKRNILQTRTFAWLFSACMDVSDRVVKGEKRLVVWVYSVGKRRRRDLGESTRCSLVKREVYTPLLVFIRCVAHALGSTTRTPEREPPSRKAASAKYCINKCGGEIFMAVPVPPPAYLLLRSLLDPLSLSLSLAVFLGLSSDVRRKRHRFVRKPGVGDRRRRKVGIYPKGRDTPGYETIFLVGFGPLHSAKRAYTQPSPRAHTHLLSWGKAQIYS